MKNNSAPTKTKMSDLPANAKINKPRKSMKLNRKIIYAD